jgi:hypothetical protein
MQLFTRMYVAKHANARTQQARGFTSILHQSPIPCAHSVGHQSCVINYTGVDGKTPFGPDPCPMVIKHLAVRVSCSGGKEATVDTTAIVHADGQLVWDGTSFTGSHPGLVSATDAGGDGVAFVTTNGVFHFASSKAPA